MTERELYIESVTFGKPDRLIIEHSFGLMPGVLERWHREGLPERVDEGNLREYFGFQGRGGGLGVNFGLMPAFEPETIETEDGVVLTRDSRGVRRRLKKGVTTIAIPYEFPIKGPEDWEDYRRRLQPDPERIAENLEQQHAALREAGRVVRVGWTGFYWFPRDLMGDEMLCMSYYTQPELVHEILNTYSDMICAVSEELLSRVDVDWMHMGEDMCYRNAMMVSPKTFREFMMPHYRRVVDLYRSHGARIFSIDTDGHLGQILPLLIEAGINAITPCEVLAGNDVVRMRREYGRKMAFMRGINKLALADDPTRLVPETRGTDALSARQAIEEELSYRLPPMVESGGYVAGLDHRVVPQTSLGSFLYYVRRARELLGLDDDVPALQELT